MTGHDKPWRAVTIRRNGRSRSPKYAADLIRQVGIAEQTYYRWKKQYAGMQSGQVRELRQLQDEISQLKKLVAEFSQDKAILQDVASKSWRGPR